MKLITIAMMTAVIVSGSAFAGGGNDNHGGNPWQNPSSLNEKVTIFQSGNSNGADVNQDTSKDSTIYVEQAGTGNYAKDYQKATNSSMTSKQYGDRNSVNLTQTAGGSSIYVQQAGVANWANVYQH